jgi:hypothetical protein
MRRVTDFRTGELRIPADRFPLPARVEELLRIYSGLGRWEGSPHAPGSVAIFELAVYRLEEVEAAFALPRPDAAIPACADLCR